MNEPVVITGAGVIASVGAGFEEFLEALYAGRSGLKPSTVIDLGEETEVQVCELAGFRPQKWLGPKGIRVLDRSARLLAVAAHLVLSQLGRELSAEEEGDPDLGLVCGTIFGSVHSITLFDWSGLEDGPKYVNPMAFPNTVINSPAGQAAIKHKLRGVNSTISAGLASSLYALNYAADFLRFGRASMLLAGGVEELAEESYLGYRKNGLLSDTGCARPFSEQRDGVVLGEGSALFALEMEGSARQRGATILAQICGFGSAHDAHSISSYSLDGEGAVRAIQQAIDTAEIGAEEVSFIVSGASGSRGGDYMELEALRQVFGEKLAHIPVCAPKAALGETQGASGALSTVVAIAALQRGEIPPTVGLVDSPAELGLSTKPQSVDGEYALVTALSCDGNNAALLLKKA